jgi:hypothetical protein
MSFLAGTLSQFWLTIQGTLFPWLQQELGELSEKQKQLIAIFELLSIESFISGSRGQPGRPTEDRRAIARAFVAKAFYNLSTTRRDCQRHGLVRDARRARGFRNTAVADRADGCRGATQPRADTEAGRCSLELFRAGSRADSCRTKKLMW